VAACRRANSAFGQPKRARGPYGAPGFDRPTAAILNGGTKVEETEKPADMAEASRRESNTDESTSMASAHVPPPTSSNPGNKPASASGSAGAPGTPPSVGSSGPSDPSARSATLPPPEAASSSTTQTASVEPAVEVPTGTTRFGIEIGTTEKQGGLWPLWHNFLTKHAALVAGLQARRRLAPDKKWQLIAGPFDSVAEATQACDLFKKENLKCEETAFAGDEL
jgi:hypothetical protein